MSCTKAYAEKISEDMGHDGEINDEVLAEGARRLRGNGTHAGQRITWAEGHEIAQAFVAALEPHGTVAVCGSYRRQKETLGDIDLVAGTTEPEAVAAAFVALLDTVLQHGKKKLSGLYQSVQVDLRIVEPESFGPCVLFCTGSAGFNISMRRLAMSRGLMLNEYRLTCRTDRRLVGEQSERDIFKTLGLDYVEPENREGF